MKSVKPTQMQEVQEDRGLAVDERTPEQKVEALQKKIKADRQFKAGSALQAHFGMQPDGVVIASIKDGKIRIDVTEFGELGNLLFAHRLISKVVEDNFNRAVQVQEVPGTDKAAPTE